MASGGTGDRIYQAGVVVAVAFLAFCAGGYLVVSKRPPYGFFRDVHLAARALTAQRTGYREAFRTDLYGKPLSAGRGVTVNVPGAASPGHTLYTSGHSPSAMLMDLDGRVLHEWHLPYSAVWHDGAAVKAPVPDERTYFRAARVFPNGDLLVIYDGVGDTPHGYGMVKMDRDARPLWSYLERAHHAFDIAPDGRIVTLTHAITTHEITRAGYLRPPRIDDFLVVLSADGRELAKVPLVETFVNSRFEGMLGLLPFYLMNGSGDFLHTNDVDVVTADIARAFPFAREGEILISMREPGVLALVDVQAAAFTWAMRGPWIGQHDPDFLANGHLLLFDNNGWFGEGDRSRIIEFDPLTGGIVWQYTGTAEAPFRSPIRGVQQRLENGNTLITDTQHGRLLEVTPDQRIVWEFFNPQRAGDGDDERIAIVSAGTRIPAERLDADFRQRLEVAARRVEGGAGP